MYAQDRPKSHGMTTDYELHNREKNKNTKTFSVIRYAKDYLGKKVTQRLTKDCQSTEIFHN